MKVLALIAGVVDLRCVHKHTSNSLYP